MHALEIIPQLPDGASFATFADILACEDRAVATVKVPRWHRNGKPLYLQLRALSLTQQVQIERESRYKDPVSGVVLMDTRKYAVATLREAGVRPQLSQAQAEELLHKNAEVVEEIVAFVWRVLSKLDARALEDRIRADATDDDTDDADHD